MVDEFLTIFGELKFAFRSFTEKLVLLNQAPVAIGIPWVDSLTTLFPDERSEFSVLTFKSFSDPFARIGPVDDVLRRSCQIPDRLIQSSELCSKPPIPDSEKVANFAIWGKVRDTYARFILAHSQFFEEFATTIRREYILLLLAVSLSGNGLGQMPDSY